MGAVHQLSRKLAVARTRRSDRLVGKLDARAERDRGVLRVEAIHRDVAFTQTVAAAVDREIRDLARWLDLEVELPG